MNKRQNKKGLENSQIESNFCSIKLFDKQWLQKVERIVRENSSRKNNSNRSTEALFLIDSYLKNRFNSESDIGHNLCGAYKSFPIVKKKSSTSTVL